MLMLIRSSDPFIHMERANKTYGFTIAVKELKETVPNIFRYASAYKRVNNITSQGLWEMFAEPAVSPKDTTLPTDDPKYKPPLPEEIMGSEAGQGGVPDIDPEAMEGEVYNMCHFWSNFEIARLDWFRSKPYNDFFDMMDRSGGFWMERVIIPQGCNINYANMIISGGMRLFIRSPLVCFYLPQIFTTSEILVIDIQRYSIARPMRPATANWLDRHSLRRQRQTRKRGEKKTNIGKHGTRSKRMELAADANVIQILLMWKASKEAVLRNGSM